MDLTRERKRTPAVDPATRPGEEAGRGLPDARRLPAWSRMLGPAPAAGPGAPIVQAQLEVGRPDTPLEREADQVAGRVAGSAEPGACDVVASGAESGAEPRPAAQITAGGIAAPPAVEDVLRGPGQPLERTLRTDMEARLGQRLGAVRVHLDAQAAESARQIGARAYSVGNRVVFGAGNYAPSTPAGRRLLAHELAHVGQQGGLAPGRQSALVHRVLTYHYQLDAAASQPYLAQFDRTVTEIEQQVSTIPQPVPADMQDAAADLQASLTMLREMRAAQPSRITCWYVTGGLAYASYDNATDQIRLHTNIGASAGSAPDMVHEGIHALHARRYPRLRQKYAEILAANGTADRRWGILMLQWKAWTEYWAYRRRAEYFNLARAPANRVDPHEYAMREDDVRRSIRRVVAETGQAFDPQTWSPPRRYLAPARSGQGSATPAPSAPSAPRTPAP